MSSKVTLQKEVLDRLQDATQLPGEMWDEITARATAAEVPSLIQISEIDLLELAEELALDPVALSQGKIDYRALAAHQAGHVTHLPEAYANGESRIRTSAHLFDVVENLFGWRERTKLLRRHQLTEAIIADPEIKINVRFVTDLCEDLRNLGLRDDQFYQMGEHSLVRNYHTSVGHELRKTRGAAELYEKCFTEIVHTHYDQNAFYHVVKLGTEHMILEARPNPDVCASLSTYRLGSRLTCLNRAGATASLTGFKHLPFAQVHETRCIHHGDPVCRFEIDFSNAVAAERRAAGTA